MPSKSRHLKTTAEESLNDSVSKALPERWSAPRKTEVILQLLRGKPLDRVSRASQVPVHELECWKREFLEAGTRGLKHHAAQEDRELLRTRAKIGELTMRLELAEDFIAKKGLTDEWTKRTR